MRRIRPFLRECRALPPRPVNPRIRTAGLAAVEAELFPRPLADDVARHIVLGRFRRSLIATQAVGA